MDKKIAPVNKRRVIAAWFGVALLSVFCITTALFLEKSTVFGEGGNESDYSNDKYTSLIPVSTNESSEGCQDVINTAKQNRSSYDDETNDALHQYSENPRQLEFQLKLIENVSDGKKSSKTQKLNALITDLQTKCGTEGEEETLADKDKCEDLEKHFEEYINELRTNRRDPNATSYVYSSLYPELENVKNGDKTPEEAKKTAIEVRTTYQQSKDQPEENSISHDAIDFFIENIGSCAPATTDPCQQAIKNIENVAENQYPDKDRQYALDLINSGSTENIRLLSAKFLQKFNALKEDHVLREFFDVNKKLLDQCAEYKTETEEQNIEGGDACEQAKKLANDDPSIGVKASEIDNLTSKELHDLSLKLSRRVDTETPALGLGHPRIKALNDMHALLDRCSTIREKEETPTTTLFGFGEQLQNKNFSKWIKANLIADILTKLIKGDWQGALPPLAALLSGNEGLTNLAASLFSGNTNPRNAWLDTVFGNPLYPNSSFYPGLQMGGYPQQEAQKMISDMFEINTYKNILGSLGSIVSRFMPEEKEVTDKDEVWDEECLEAFRAKQKAKENAENEEGDTETPAEEEATQPDSTPADTEEQGTTEETTTQTTATVTVTKTTTTTPPGKYDNITSEDQCKTIVETPRTTTPRADFLGDFDGWLEDLSGLAQAVVASKYSHLANPGYYDNSSALNWLMGGYGSNYPNYNPYNSSYGYPTSSQNQNSYGSSYNPYTQTYNGQYPSGYNAHTNNQQYNNATNTIQQGTFSVILRNIASLFGQGLATVTGNIFSVNNVPGIFLNPTNTQDVFRFSGIDNVSGKTIWEKVAQ